MPAHILGRQLVAGPPSAGESGAVPNDVSLHLGAIRFGDATQILETFESDAVIVDAFGDAHEKKGGAMRKFYEERLPVAEGSTTWVPAVRSVTDTGRIVAVEYETSGTGHLGLLVLERGESGLFREARLYDSALRSNAS